MIKFIGRWLRTIEGTTAIEFSLVGFPFIITLVAIVEVSLAYATSTLVEGATNTAARMIRTGQIQQAGGDEEQAFRDAFCDEAYILVDCSKVQLEVMTMPDGTFSHAGDYAVQYDADGNMVSRGFDAGTANDVVLVRVYYPYPFITPMIGNLIGDAHGDMPILSTTVFQTEPYLLEE